MTDQALRDLQDRFLAALDEQGFHKRVKDSATVSLFEPGSPTIISLQRDLYPSYATKMLEYLELVDVSTELRPRPSYYKHHGRCRPDQDCAEEGRADSGSVQDVQQSDSSWKARETVSAMPIKRLIKRPIQQG